MIVPCSPDASSPGPRGPEVFWPSGGSCPSAAATDADMWLSCHWISAATAACWIGRGEARRLGGVRGGTERVRPHVGHRRGLSRGSGGRDRGRSVHVTRSSATGEPPANLLGDIELASSERSVSSPRRQACHDPPRVGSCCSARERAERDGGDGFECLAGSAVAGLGGHPREHGLDVVGQRGWIGVVRELAGDLRLVQPREQCRAARGAAVLEERFGVDEAAARVGRLRVLVRGQLEDTGDGGACLSVPAGR